MSFVAAQGGGTHLDSLFENIPGFSLCREKAIRMAKEGFSEADICLELLISPRTLSSWLKLAGQSSGDPDLDQVSFIDGLTDRERNT